MRILLLLALICISGLLYSQNIDHEDLEKNLKSGKITFLEVLKNLVDRVDSLEKKDRENQKPEEYEKKLEWLKMSLYGESVNNMQEISIAMIEYHKKNGKLPSKPSDLKGYFVIKYKNLEHRVFLSPSDTTTFNYQSKAWDFVDKHSSYILHQKANMQNRRDVLVSEKSYFLWPKKKGYVFVDGHGDLLSEKELDEFQKAKK
ncbi:hypothetical protein [Candidatus Uabimicrobium sp. HlEnr_7]|uniref:hypothetical protein n=1 Tax=Candidatus Uabimicrobium helgolandensis TaxID=3095367 RepID=UPI003558F060